MREPVIALISGKVVRGDGYGRQLGFPTANLDRRQYVREGMKLKFGVYAGWAVVGEDIILPKNLKRYRAGIVIGPLEKKGLPKIEAHLLNFKDNLYGRTLTVVLTKYLRPFKKFKDVEDLKGQIGKDIKQVGRVVRL